MKNIYVVIELRDGGTPKILGVYSNKESARKCMNHAFARGAWWVNIMQTVVNTAFNAGDEKNFQIIV